MKIGKIDAKRKTRQTNMAFDRVFCNGVWVVISARVFSERGKIFRRMLHIAAQRIPWQAFAEKYGLKLTFLFARTLITCKCTERPDQPRERAVRNIAVEKGRIFAALTPLEISKKPKIAAVICLGAPRYSVIAPIQPMIEEKNATRAQTFSIEIAECEMALVKSSTLFFSA